MLWQLGLACLLYCYLAIVLGSTLLQVSAPSLNSSHCFTSNSQVQFIIYQGFKRLVKSCSNQQEGAEIEGIHLVCCSLWLWPCWNQHTYLPQCEDNQHSNQLCDKSMTSIQLVVVGDLYVTSHKIVTCMHPITFTGLKQSKNVHDTARRESSINNGYWVFFTSILQASLPSQPEEATHAYWEVLVTYGAGVITTAVSLVLEVLTSKTALCP